MAVKTVAWLRGKISPEQIAEVMQQKYGTIAAVQYISYGCAQILFGETVRHDDTAYEPEKERQMFHTPSERNDETGEDGEWTYLSCGAFGHGPLIMEILATHFGGTFLPNDHDGIAVNRELSGHERLARLSGTEAA